MQDFFLFVISKRKAPPGSAFIANGFLQATKWETKMEEPHVLNNEVQYIVENPKQ